MFTVQMLIENIREAISSAGIKQKSLAEKIGRSEQEMSNMLNGRTNITPIDLARMASVLNVDINEFYKIR